ncbi:hypothetical protein A4X09_0g7816, partial [Tilletia walkeri]
SERQDQGPLPTETTSGWCFKAQGDDAETNQGGLTGSVYRI